jgi:hypothetical protein
VSAQLSCPRGGGPGAKRTRTGTHRRAVPASVAHSCHGFLEVEPRKQAVHAVHEREHAHRLTPAGRASDRWAWLSSTRPVWLYYRTARLRGVHDGVRVETPNRAHPPMHLVQPVARPPRPAHGTPAVAVCRALVAGVCVAAAFVALAGQVRPCLSTVRSRLCPEPGGAADARARSSQDDAAATVLAAEPLHTRGYTGSQNVFDDGYKPPVLGHWYAAICVALRVAEFPAVRGCAEIRSGRLFQRLASHAERPTRRVQKDDQGDMKWLTGREYVNAYGTDDPTAGKFLGHTRKEISQAPSL